MVAIFSINVGLIMSFLPHEPAIMVNVKLTDTGRRLLSLGQLTYKKAVLSDREVDYDIDHTGAFSIPLGMVMAPKDDNPSLPPLNFDGTQPIGLGSHLFGGTFVSTGTCPTSGFFVTGTDATFNGSNNSTFLSIDDISAADLDGTNIAALSSGYVPRAGDLAFVVFVNPSGGGVVGSALVALWYRITGDSNSITADRAFPDFSTAGSSETSTAYHFPWNGMNYYGSGSTVDPQLWNMNIVRSSSEIGTPLGASGYTEYGSREYNGQKHRLGLDNQYRQVGFIHYTNEFTGNTYSEQLSPGSVEVNIPYLMWHREDSVVGEMETMGHRFLDAGSPILYDDVARTHYTVLRDGTSDGIPVGRVYQKLKLIAITDPELLNALTYKSNRNWTLPPLIVNERATPLTTYGATIYSTSGCLVQNMTYYVTYVATCDTLSWGPNDSYGYQPFLHCGYIQKVTGHTDSDGHSSYLSAKFGPRSFPYMRSETNMTALDGTGWVANRITLLIKGVPTDSDPGLDKIGSDGWTLLSGAGMNGEYYGGDHGSNVIDPELLQDYEFVVDQSDIDAGTPYVLNSGFTSSIDFRASGNTLGMNFGNEQFFFGNINAKTKRTKYKTVISLQMAEAEFNTSNNPTFSIGEDTKTYLTEVGILDDENRLVAVGKFTQPVEKSDTQFLLLQLEMDF